MALIGFVKNIIKKYGFIFSVFFTIAIILIFHFTGFHALKLYPVIVNFIIFMLFFTSLFQEETIIQKFARMAEGELKEPVKIYTKKLTYIWCVFLLLQLLCSIITCFMSDKIWIIYNGCISYVLLSCFFAIEYLFRTVFKKRNNL